jgi:hypothetical protein
MDDTHGTYVREENTYRVSASNTGRNIPLGKSGHGWENKIKMYLTEIRLGVVALTGFIRLRIGTICGHDSEPSSCIQCMEFLDYLRNLSASQGLCCTELLSVYPTSNLPTHRNTHCVIYSFHPLR